MPLLCRNSSLDSQWVISKILKTSHIRKALIIGCSLQAFQQLAGINTIMFVNRALEEEEPRLGTMPGRLFKQLGLRTIIRPYGSLSEHLVSLNSKIKNKFSNEHNWECYSVLADWEGKHHGEDCGQDFGLEGGELTPGKPPLATTLIKAWNNDLGRSEEDSVV